MHLTWVLTLLFVIDVQSQSQAYTLPEGSVSEGKIAFIELSCNACHAVGDVKRARSAEEDIMVVLGVPNNGEMTYGNLVTSIIDPSHKVAPKYRKAYMTAAGESKMLTYSDVIMVQELIDLVAFLQDEYGIETPKNCDCTH